LYVPESGIRWNFHVAPIVYVKDDHNNIQKMVIDPSLFDRPVSVAEWDAKMTKETARGSVQTVFPFPENAALMERSAIAFSSSDPYKPRESVPEADEEKMKENEKDKMEQANTTMAKYKGLEQ
ncbi:MAG: hypothetical protein K2Q18_05910, partial [Bdellovibrionales bacterium]|nr:hypothetical protein [Bdellovibrionales bacterium]